MCFDAGARPPLPPIRGSALDAGEQTLVSRDGTRVRAYGAFAEGGADAPGMLIIPDVRGLHPYYEELALRFAQAGVHALALDLYERTAGDQPRGPGFEHEPHVLQLDPATVNDDVAAGAAWLRERAARVFSIGFCLGGRISLLQAGSGLGLAGVIGLYPWPVNEHRSGIPSPAEAAPHFACPVLAIYGGADRGIPEEDRIAFDRALAAAGVEHRSVTFEDAPHSFFDRKAEDHAEASAATWREVLGFVTGTTAV